MKKSYRFIADELGVSVKTVYRVLNQAPEVRDETRKRVIAALNRNGFFDAQRIGREKVLIDLAENSWSRRIALLLAQQLDRKIFDVVLISREQSPVEFFRKLEQVATVVHTSDPCTTILDQVREKNPFVMQVNLFGNAGGDITLGEDHYLGGKLAARYFTEKKPKLLWIFSYEHRSGHRNRADAFELEIKRFLPTTKIERFAIKNGDEALIKTSFSGIILPQAVFCSCGYLGKCAALAMGKVAESDLLVYDGPRESGIEEFPTAINTVEFNLPQVLDLAEYYLTKCPLLRHQGPFTTRVAPHLEVRSSRS